MALDVLLWVAVFVASLLVLIKSSDYFTLSAEKIGLYFGLPAFIIGVTIVALGTSLPELLSSIIAVLQGSSEMVVGNVIGSNIANIFLVLGISAIIGKKLKIGFELMHVDLPILMASALYLAVTIWDGVFTWGEGVLGLAGLVVYILYTVNTEREDKHTKTKKAVKKIKIKKSFPIKPSVILLISGFFIFIGAKYTVESVIKLSQIFNIGTEIIAVSAVALGTSLPELMVSISAARKGNAEMAVGNVLGSNIFNAFAVMGIPAFFGALVVPSTILSFGLPMMLIASFLYLIMTMEREVTRWEGWTLLIFYVFFIGKTFGMF
jgi:cation:H+ antiporter